MRRLHLCSLFLCIFILGELYPQVPHNLSYQGMLTGTGGDVVDDGLYELHFKLYNGTDPSTALWAETQNVAVVNGIFNAILGSVNPLELPFDEQYYLGIAVAEEPELSPRIALTSSAYSFRARSIDDGQVVKSINELKDDILFEAGENISIIEDENKIIISAESTGGTSNITQITAGEGLTGGGTEGEVTLAVEEEGITSDKLASGAVTSSKLADESVTQEKLHPQVSLPISGEAGGDLTGTYPDPEIADGIVTSEKIAPNAVTGSELAGGAISNVHVSNNAAIATGKLSGSVFNITNHALGDLAALSEVETPHITDLAVTTSKIADNAISTSKLIDQSVTQEKLHPDISLAISGNAGGDLTGTYPDPEIAEGAVTPDKIASGAVDLGSDKVTGTLEISGGGTGATSPANARTNLGLGTLSTLDAVETPHIADGAVTQEKIDPDVSFPISGPAGGDLTGTYPNPEIAEGAVTADKVKFPFTGEGTFRILNNGLGAAIRGDATRTDVFNEGIWGETASTFGKGVYGNATASTGATTGVYGRSQSTNGTAVYGWAVSSSGNTYGVYGRSESPNGRAVFGWAFGSNGTTIGVAGQSQSTGGRGVFGVAAAASGTNYGVYGRSMSPDGYGVYSDGRFAATGTKDFQIDHPLDPANKYLNHFSAEGPEPYLIYKGIVILDATGFASVNLPDYFETINRDFHYQLTPIGGAAPDLHVSSKVTNNRFEIGGGKPGLEVSWTVMGVRNDPFVRNNPVTDVQEKPVEHRGRYLQPQFYGQPASMGISYDEYLGEDINEN